eukprot:PhM_4_TR4053/c0_g1_i1/m.99496
MADTDLGYGGVYTHERKDQEIQCRNTIITCLDCFARGVPMDGHTEVVAPSEVMELLDLLVSLLSNDPTPLRLHDLLFETYGGIDNTLMVLLAVARSCVDSGATSSERADVGTLTIQTISKVLSLCNTEPFTPPHAVANTTSLTHMAFRSFEASGGVAILVEAISHQGLTDGVAQLRIAASECLFVFVMRVEEGCREVAAVHLKRLLALVVVDKTEMIRNYCCAVLRVVAEKHTEDFVSTEVFVQIAHILTVETSSYVQVLLLELCLVVCTSFHIFYLTHVFAEPAFVNMFCSLARLVLTDDRSRDVQDAMCRLIVRTCEKEMVFYGVEGNQGPSFAALCMQHELWQPLLTTSPESVRQKMNSLRWIINACVTPTTIELLHRSMPALFPAVSLLLNKNDKDGWAQDSSESVVIETELAILLGTLFAKHPMLRVYVQNTVAQFPVWSEQMRSKMRALVSGASHDQLAGVDLIDFRGVLLNCPTSIPGVENSDLVDFSNTSAMDSLAMGMLQQQAMNAPARTARGAVSASASLSSAMERRRVALTEAVLCAALTIALSDQLRVSISMSHSPPRAASIETQQVVAVPTKHRRVLTPVYPYDVATEGQQQQQGHSTPHREAPHMADTQSSFTAPSDAVAVAVTPSGARHKPQVNDEKRRQWLMHGKGIFGSKLESSPLPRTPFKPASPCSNVFSNPVHSGKRTDFTPRAKGSSMTPQRGAVALQSGSATTGGPCSTLGSGNILNSESTESDYVDVAILMHLPITFGAHYNRSAREASCRILEGPAGPVVQPLYRSTTQQSWTIRDVLSKDLFRFFIPFQKMTPERVDEELERLRKHLLRTKKNLAMTPNTQRTRRWFLHDMMNYILPKTENVLHEFKELLIQHTPENFSFALGMVRLMDQGQGTPETGIGMESNELIAVDEDLERYRQDMVLQDVLRLSVGRYKDIVHCGNILYALDRAKRYFAEQSQKLVADREARPPHLRDIEAEIERLEHQHEADTWDNVHAESDDDVEDEHEDSDDDALEEQYQRDVARMRGTPDPDAIMTQFEEELGLSGVPLPPKALLREANLPMPSEAVSRPGARYADPTTSMLRMDENLEEMMYGSGGMGDYMGHHGGVSESDDLGSLDYDL